MIKKLFSGFSSSAYTFLKNMPPTQETIRILDFCKFFQGVTKQYKEKKLYNFEQALNSMQKYDIDQLNLETLQLMYQNVFDHSQLNDAFNNLLGVQIILINKGINSNIVSREFLNSYVSYLNNYHVIMQCNIFYTTNLVQFLYQIKRNFGSLNNAEQRILYYVCDSYYNYIQYIRPNYICTQFYYLSKLNIGYYSLKHFLNLQILFIKRIADVLNEFNETQLKSLYYSIGRDGFYNDKIKEFIIKKMEENAEIKTSEQFNTQINLFLCATNLLNSPEMKNKFLKQIKNIIQVQNLFLDTRQTQLLQFYSQIIRCEIFDDFIWNSFFKIQFKIQDSFRKDFISYNLIQFKSKLSQTIQNYVEQHFERNKNDYLQRLCSTQSNSAKTMEKNIQGLFNELNLNYEKNIHIDQFEVDFYFPKYNLIVETCGPIHYAFNIDAKEGVAIKIQKQDQEIYANQYLNQTSLFKKKYLENLGYRVNYLNFFDQREKSVQVQILEYLDSLK